eukprot:sb/3469768/
MSSRIRTNGFPGRGSRGRGRGPNPRRGRRPSIVQRARAEQQPTTNTNQPHPRARKTGGAVFLFNFLPINKQEIEKLMIDITNNETYSGQTILKPSERSGLLYFEGPTPPVPLGFIAMKYEDYPRYVEVKLATGTDPSFFNNQDKLTQTLKRTVGTLFPLTKAKLVPILPPRITERGVWLTTNCPAVPGTKNGRPYLPHELSFGAIKVISINIIGAAEKGKT